MSIQLSSGSVRLLLEPGTGRLEGLGRMWSETAYRYHAVVEGPDGTVRRVGLTGVRADLRGETLTVEGSLGGLHLVQRFQPAGPEALEESVRITNTTPATLRVHELELGFERRLTDAVARVLSDVEGDRVAAVPFRIRPTDPAGRVNDWSIAELRSAPGHDQRIDEHLAYGELPGRHRYSEAWVWSCAVGSLGVFKHNQEALEYSILSTEAREDGLWMRIGGCCLFNGEPSCLRSVAAGAAVELGVTRYQFLAGGYDAAARAYRVFLDGQGCVYPRGYNPPVHWNELYDNPFWSLASPRGARNGRLAPRATTYTREHMETEAVKAAAYGCESLYLDPGWDTSFGSFHWDTARLGPLPVFVREMRERHGLDVSLHCPLATWVSSPVHRWDDTGLTTWPAEAARMDAEGRRIESSLCLGSRAYLDEAERRMHALTDGGVRFLMFDGNWHNGGCWNPDHGHPVPYLAEDNVRANLDLARRVHRRHPEVLIEMHDMVSGGTHIRWTPVYYKYGLPLSYDENWGFELMWNPFADLRDGRARSLYYYNLACNVPVYLHVDLRDDNEHCLVLWWFASTCRHLGFGGTHASPAVVTAQQAAMRRYRSLERFFKRGVFHGAGEEVHLHVLPEEQEAVVQIFNLSGERRRITGSIAMADLGLDPERWYTRSERWVGFDRDRLQVSWELAPWGTELLHLKAV